MSFLEAVAIGVCAWAAITFVEVLLVWWNDLDL